MVTIKGVFALDLMLSNEWNDYRKENKIIDPWHKPLPKIKTVKDEIEINGVLLPCWKHKIEESNWTETTEEERLEYRRLENMWKGEKILPEVSWEEFLRWLQVRDGVSEEDFCPCDAKDGQCSWTCRNFYSGCEKRKAE